jgi:tetratricopeptide (TPR) repeat protein
MNNITTRLQNIKKLQAKRWDNDEEHWDEINELLIKELDEILLIEPENTVALVDLGTIYSDLGENEQAMYYLKQALKLGSEDKNLYINIAIVMVDMGMHAEEFHEYLEIAEDKEEDPLTFKAYFDPQSY